MLKGFSSSNQARFNPTSQKVETLPSNSNMEEYRKHRQYAMAWEFEMWHWAKESKWQTGMKERESVRMGMLKENLRKWKPFILVTGRDVASKGSNLFWFPLFIFQLGCKAGI